MTTVYQLYFLLFCAIGCITHLTFVAREYSKKEVDQYLSVDLKDTIEMPRLSVCFEIIKFQDFTHLVYELFNITYDNYIQFFEELDGKLTLHDIYNVLPKERQLIQPRSLPNKIENNRIVRTSLKTFTYFFEPFYCLAVGPNTTEPYIVHEDDLGLSEHGGIFFALHLSKKVIKFHTSLFIFVHPHNTLMHEASLSLKMLSLNTTKSSCAFTFEIATFQLLPYPYTTDCLDYRKIGFETQSQAIDTCMQKTSVKVFNRSLAYSSASVLSNAFSGYGFSFMIKKNFTKYEMLKSIKIECTNRYYKPDCIRKEFFINDFWVNSGFESFATIKIRTINFPVMEITTRERISLAQTILYLGSILGLWFGFSLAFVAPVTVRYFEDKIYKCFLLSSGINIGENSEVI